MRPDRAKDTRPKKVKAESKISVAVSKISVAVRRWLAEVLPQLADVDIDVDNVDALVGQAPKRWTVYEPMVLLPTGSFGMQTQTQTQIAGQVDAAVPSRPTSLSPWPRLLAAVSADQRDALWCGILAALSPAVGGQLTHLAVNEGIPLHVDAAGSGAGGSSGSDGEENILRSPTGLRPLYGDFGPIGSMSGALAAAPTEADFARALWVSTRQNGIVQTWAPRWSMFSRGNITEKARLLAWEGGRGTREVGVLKGPQEQGPTASEARTKKQRTKEQTGWAVDLYAGIGYFVFSYARRGLRVLCWELNPWSAEALRRGGVRNGWRVRVVMGVKRGQQQEEEEEETLFRKHTLDAVGADADDDNDSKAQIIVFVEDNRHAARRMAVLHEAHVRLPVAHVNCGMLPTSRDSWRTAWDAVVVVGEGQNQGGGRTAWLHLHENVGVTDVDARRQEIQQLMDSWAVDGSGVSGVSGVSRVSGASCHALVEHVELVKTFAPGVWHCVFDVRITLP